jgi:hypothetical protein
MNSFAFACNDRRVVGGHIAGFVVWNVDTGSQLWNAPMKIPKDNDDFIGECYILHRVEITRYLLASEGRS